MPLHLPVGRSLTSSLVDPDKLPESTPNAASSLADQGEVSESATNIVNAQEAVPSAAVASQAYAYVAEVPLE